MDPGYIRELGHGYDAWLGQLRDTTVLTIDNSELDFLARPEDLQAVVGSINETLARKASDTPSGMAAEEVLRNGGLSGFQQFHRRQDGGEQFEADLYFDYLRLSDEAGKMARELADIRRAEKLLAGDGLSAGDAHEEAIRRHRAALRSELADLFAFLLTLANDSGIDLEQAYVDKMGQRVGPDRAGGEEAG
jgi:hypothetical protein